MEFLGVIFGAIVLFHLLRWIVGNIRQTRADDAMRAVGKFAPELDRRADSQNVSSWRRAGYFFRALFGSRKIENHEFYVDVQMAETKMEIGFYVPRRVFHIDVFFMRHASLQIKNIQFHFADGETGERFGRKTAFLGQRLRIRLYPPALKAISKTVLTFQKTNQDFSYEIQMKVPHDRNEDYRIVKEAMEHYNQARFAIALETLKEYLEYATNNPFVYYYMADACLRMQAYSEFEEFILKSMVYGWGSPGGDHYRLFMNDHWASDIADIMKIRDGCKQWSLDQHHGLVVVEFDQDYRLGLNHYYLRKVRQVVEVRRPVAARIFTRTGFDFTSKQFLLFTACRVIRNDGTIVDLPQERFVVADSQERNIYIAVEQSKSGLWILPDLAPGDMVEMSYHLICPESFNVNDSRVPLSIVTTVHDQSLPTYMGRTRLRVPRDHRMRCSLRDPKHFIDLTEAEEGDYRVASLKIDQYIPVRNTNSYFEAYLYNPVAACTTDEKAWPEVAGALMVTNFGSLNPEEDLPHPLQDFVAESSSPEEAMSKAFYWTRDKLKYAAVDSAVRIIGQPNRAAAIVDSGMADCKDKSYLLYLTGKKLGLDIQIVAVSSRHGIIFADLPGDQFDHVFVRVRLNDRWHYLDAANRAAVFDSCPSLYQGMDMLVLTDRGRPETIQIAPPENSRIIITETLDEISQGWLNGSFHLEARGNIARLIDENWKSQSLQAKDSLQAAQSIIQSFMPSSVLMSFDRLSHTSHTDVFEVLGMIHRCQLSPVGKHLVCTLEWNEPTIPTGIWRIFRTDQAFGFSQPSMIEMHTVFTGDLPARMTEYSDPFSMDNELCDISADATHQDGNIIMRRRVVIKEKFVNKELLELVPRVMEGIEKTFQTAIVLENN